MMEIVLDKKELKLRTSSSRCGASGWSKRSRVVKRQMCQDESVYWMELLVEAGITKTELLESLMK